MGLDGRQLVELTCGRLQLDQIRYSQARFSSHFQSLTPLEEMQCLLQSGKLHVDSLRDIKVVAYNREWFSMDNRRLYCMKQALPPTTQIRVLMHSRGAGTPGRAGAGA